MTEFKNTITAFINTIKDKARNLYATANTRKSELAVAIDNMGKAYRDLYEFSATLGMLREINIIADEATVATDFLDEMLADMNVIEAPIEQFYGYCEHCGDEILKTDESTFIDSDLVCGRCADVYHNAMIQDDPAEPNTQYRLDV